MIEPTPTQEQLEKVAALISNDDVRFLILAGAPEPVVSTILGRKLKALIDKGE